jgi:hypothetical protein
MALARVTTTTSRGAGTSCRVPAKYWLRNNRPSKHGLRAVPRCARWASPDVAYHGTQRGVNRRLLPDRACGRNGRCGRLWQNRFASCALSPAYLQAPLRYMELRRTTNARQVLGDDAFVELLRNRPEPRCLADGTNQPCGRLREADDADMRYGQALPQGGRS